MVKEAEDKANNTVELALKTTADSEAKSQQLITSLQRQSEKKIAFTTHWANKRIESSKMDVECRANKIIQLSKIDVERRANKIIESSMMNVERLQQDCHTKAMALSKAEKSILKILKITSDHAHELLSLSSQHKFALRDTQA